MANIYLGPAGIPLASKEFNTISGIKTVAKLGLNAMEIEFVRNIYMNPELAREIGKTAKKLGIKLSVHAPYYINLCSTNKETVEESIERIFNSVYKGEMMGAEIVAVHAGYYGNLSKQKAFEIVKEKLRIVLDKMKENNIKYTKLGVETTGRIKQFGTLDEIIKLCKQINCFPVIDFAHIFARNGGKINYSNIFDKLNVLNLKHLHSHFEGIKWDPVEGTGFGNERYHLPIETNQPPFEPLAKEILERDLNITIISESPILERDSLYMVRVFRKLGYSLKFL
jgi:deoxyribonuclease-4